MGNKWISINIMSTWVGFAWFGWLMLEHVKTKKKVKVEACGTYCVTDGKLDMKFKIDWDRNDNLDDYDIIAYKTKPEKEINLFSDVGVFL